MKKQFFIVCCFFSIFCFGGGSDSLISLLRKNPSNNQEKVFLLNNVGRVLQREGNLISSKQYFESSIHIGDSLHFKAGLAQAYNWFAITLRELGDYTKATGAQIKSMQYYTDLNDTTGISRSYLSIGNIYISMGDFPNALKYLMPALNLAYIKKDEGTVATCQGNMAICFNAILQLDSAEKYYFKAINHYKKIGSEGDIASLYGNMGLLKLDQKKHKEALYFLHKALDYHTKMNDLIGMASALNNIGEIFLDLKDYKKALLSFQKGYELSLKSGSRGTIFSAYLSLTNGFELSGDYKNALTFLEKYVTTKDSLLNFENAKNIEEMQTRFATEKKEKEIELLQKDKNIRELQLSKQDADIRKQRILIFSVIGGLTLIIILILFILKSYREKRKINIGLERKNIEINLQKNLIEEKNTLITDSIDYARNIQNAILPSDELIEEHLPESFILFLPKDVVSGDFYWLSPLRSPKANISPAGEKISPSRGAVRQGQTGGESVLFATIDCTGHGVPGAFMSVMAYNMIENIIADKKSECPSLILDELNKTVRESLKQDIETTSVKYGMDISLIAFNKTTNELQFAGAHNPLHIIRNGELIELKADKTTVGMALEKFTNHTVQIQKEDTLYLFTDGYADQKGGAENKKLFALEFKELLISMSKNPIEEQREKLLQFFSKRKGDNEQLDDVLIAGIRI